MEDLVGKGWVEQTKKGDMERDQKMLADSLQHVRAEVIARLGGTAITIRNFLDMKEGDVVELDQRIEEPLEILIQGRTKALAKPGFVGKKKGFRIIEVCDPEEIING